MQVLDRPVDFSNNLLGRCRGAPEPTYAASGFVRDSSDLGSAARLRHYPSPMSGTPPLPSKPHESGDRARGSFQPSALDAYRGYAATQGEFREQFGPPSVARSAETSERFQQSYHRPDESVSLPRPYTSQTGQGMLQHAYLPLPGSTSVQTGYPGSSQIAVPENPAFSSPKSQRKTKGHVASACVPCKRAHLRCDAQRPCSRCLSNGKEDACIDVQHKKRGRPRLREDRDLRYDIPGRPGYAQDTSVRRPLSLYASAPSASAFDETLRRTQSYRVLKSQPADPVVPRFIERGSASDANIIAEPLSISTRIPEPAAFLTMDFQIGKASSTFVDAIGARTVRGLRLVDIITPNDRDRVLSHQRQMLDEQARKEPQYLPPIFGKQEEDRVIQTLGFSPEDLSRYPLDKHEFLTFVAQDGQPRGFPVRLGLAKKESIYFVVILLNFGVRALGPPTPSPHSRDLRDAPFAYQSIQQPYSQPTPVSATFDPRRHRLEDTAYSSRSIQPPGHGTSTYDPGLSLSYGTSTGRPDYPTESSAYQVPRSEVATVPAAGQQANYRLPPILMQQQVTQSSSESSWPQREDRSRVDIGGLIDKPGSSSHRR